MCKKKQRKGLLKERKNVVWIFFWDGKKNKHRQKINLSFVLFPKERSTCGANSWQHTGTEGPHGPSSLRPRVLPNTGKMHLEKKQHDCSKKEKNGGHLVYLLTTHWTYHNFPCQELLLGYRWTWTWREQRAVSLDEICPQRKDLTTKKKHVESPSPNRALDAWTHGVISTQRTRPWTLCEQRAVSLDELYPQRKDFTAKKIKKLKKRKPSEAQRPWNNPWSVQA